MADRVDQPTSRSPETGDVMRPRRRRRASQSMDDSTVEHLGFDIPFTQVPNVVICDRRMSPEARAVLIFILSKSESWQIKLGPMRHLVGKIGKSISQRKMLRIVNEIIAAGYMARRQTRNPTGGFGRVRYVCGMPDRLTASINRGQV
jgi:hypothetical protein